jgi:hypothetical protein
MVLAFVNWLGFASWSALINNFAKEAAGFTGQDIGILQSVREIPGFLAFTAIILFWIMREQILAYLSLITLGIGVAITGFYPTLGRPAADHHDHVARLPLLRDLAAIAAAPAAAESGGAAPARQDRRRLRDGAASRLRVDRRDLAGLPAGLCHRLRGGGLVTVALTLRPGCCFRAFRAAVPQNKGFVLRKRYWLYYALTFMSGARRQIFMAFGGFLLVERFGYDVSATATLLLATYGINTFMGPMLGNLVGKVGERATIQMENISLIAVFVGYALASHGHFAGWGVYVPARSSSPMACSSR